MMDDQIKTVFSVVASAVFGSGVITWLFKTSVERAVGRLDRIEAKVNDLMAQNAAMMVRVGEVASLKEDLSDVLERQIHLEIRASEHKKDIDAAHEKIRTYREY
jgi:hypothetical protein